MATIFERVKKIIVEQLGVDDEEVVPHPLSRRLLIKVRDAPQKDDQHADDNPRPDG